MGSVGDGASVVQVATVGSHADWVGDEALALAVLIGDTVSRGLPVFEEDVISITNAEREPEAVALVVTLATLSGGTQ